MSIIQKYFNIKAFILYNYILLLIIEGKFKKYYRNNICQIYNPKEKSKNISRVPTFENMENINIDVCNIVKSILYIGHYAMNEIKDFSISKINALVECGRTLSDKTLGLKDIYN